MAPDISFSRGFVGIPRNLRSGDSSIVASACLANNPKHICGESAHRHAFFMAGFSPLCGRMCSGLVVDQEAAEEQTV